METNLAKFSNIIPAGVISALVGSAFIILILWRFAEMTFTDPGETKPFPIVKIIGSLILVVALVLGKAAIFKFIIAIANYIADSIYNPERTQIILDQLFPATLSDQLNVDLFHINGMELIGAGIGMLAKIAFHVLNYLRYFILAILFIFSPLAFALALIPMFGLRYLIHYFVTIAQVASWPIFQSILLLLIEGINQNYTHTNTVAIAEYIGLMCLCFVCIALIPLIAQIIFGGGNFSPISVISVGASTQVMKNLGMNITKMGMNAGTETSTWQSVRASAQMAKTNAKAGLGMTKDNIKDFIKTPFKP